VSRCRPFLLQGEPIHCATTCASLRAFLKRDPVFGPATESLRESWGKAVAPSPRLGSLWPDRVRSNLLHGQVAIHVIATLNLIRQAREKALLEVEESAFEVPATVKEPMRFQPAGYVQAQVGTRCRRCSTPPR
jgi:hypothetical protein